MKSARAENLAAVVIKPFIRQSFAICATCSGNNWPLIGTNTPPAWRRQRSKRPELPTLRGIFPFCRYVQAQRRSTPAKCSARSATSGVAQPLFSVDQRLFLRLTTGALAQHVPHQKIHNALLSDLFPYF